MALIPRGLNAQEVSDGLDTIIVKHNAPAIAVVIVRSDCSELICRGVRRHGNSTAVAKTDDFMFGPLTSTLLPLVLCRLIEQGAFKWSSTLAELLPDFRVSIHPNHQNTTIEMLSTHTSGIITKFPELDNGTLSAKLTGTKVGGIQGRRRTLLSALRNPPERKPGPGSSYRNAVNLMILAFIVETVIGEEWSMILKREVLEPLNMQQCDIGLPEEYKRKPWSNLVPWPHETGTERTVPVPPDGIESSPWLSCAATYPALGLHGQLASVETYLQFCLRSYSSDDSFSSFIRPYNRQMMFQFPPGGEFTFGGFDAIREEWTRGDGFKCAGHVSGFSTGVWIAPEIDYAFFVVVNVDGANGRAIRESVYQLLV
jgi:CubicO group peptidase (beta-lactamase class C family)